MLFDYWFSYSAHMNDWFGFSANSSIFVLYAIFLIAAGIVNMFQVSDHGDAEHDLGVLAHGRRGVHRARADHRPGPATRAFGYVFGETVNAPGYGNAADNFSNPAFWFVFGLGLLLSQYTITGLRRLGAHGRGDAQASRMAAVGMYMSVVVSVIFGWILLLAVTFAIPSTQGALDNIGVVVP